MSTMAWLQINGNIENSAQWSQNEDVGARGITVVTVDVISCQIMVRIFKTIFFLLDQCRIFKNV